MLQSSNKFIIYTEITAEHQVEKRFIKVDDEPHGSSCYLVFSIYIYIYI
jgi:hypothetical protein